ncbi:hypothetical protein LINPERPRIM_LOCUS397 [Linum perenne]
MLPSLALLSPSLCEIGGRNQRSDAGDASSRRTVVSAALVILSTLSIYLAVSKEQQQQHSAAAALSSTQHCSHIHHLAEYVPMHDGVVAKARWEVEKQLDAAAAAAAAAAALRMKI